jgi:hypothetical protein
VNIIPMGRPSPDRAIGSEIAGWPVRFVMAVKGANRL